MIKFIILSAFLNTGEMHAMPPEETRIEVRKRGKGQRGRKRGGGGLR